VKERVNKKEWKRINTERSKENRKRQRKKQEQRRN
jgi:hypothetical protein